MSQKIENFYTKLKDFTDRTNKIRSKTVSTSEFKKEASEVYETWMAEILPMLRDLKIKNNVYSRLDESFDFLNSLAKERVTKVSWFKTNLSDTKDRFFEEVILKVRKIESPEPTADLMDASTFLGLDTNWSVAACALQLQEVAVILVARRKNIDLDKKSVEKMLNKSIKDSFFFNDQYDAFSQEVKRRFQVDMPILTKHLRKMRTEVLHEGYNPKPEERDPIASFTIGLLKKLRNICDMT